MISSVRDKTLFFWQNRSNFSILSVCFLCSYPLRISYCVIIEKNKLLMLIQIFRCFCDYNRVLPHKFNEYIGINQKPQSNLGSQYLLSNAIFSNSSISFFRHPGKCFFEKAHDLIFMRLFFMNLFRNYDVKGQSIAHYQKFIGHFL